MHPVNLIKSPFQTQELDELFFVSKLQACVSVDDTNDAVSMFYWNVLTTETRK